MGHDSGKHNDGVQKTYLTKLDRSFEDIAVEPLTICDESIALVICFGCHRDGRECQMDYLHG